MHDHYQFHGTAIHLKQKVEDAIDSIKQSIMGLNEDSGVKGQILILITGTEVMQQTLHGGVVQSQAITVLLHLSTDTICGSA